MISDVRNRSNTTYWNATPSLGPEARAAYIGREISHDVGYAHYCTTRDWNARAGNELTVPYAAEAAIQACYAEVIKGEAPQAPKKLQRTVTGNDSHAQPVDKHASDKKFEHK